MNNKIKNEYINNHEFYIRTKEKTYKCFYIEGKLKFDNDLLTFDKEFEISFDSKSFNKIDDILEKLKYKDSDLDGLTDYEEIYLYLTNPLSKDSDLNGLTDYEEKKLFKEKEM